ncbi:conserved Plasmodium membrane protein, unknown function [Plasmodium relictum]|uniref:RGS domain-containing protein n=1 Tax=Plasmodium relictum TaxID=85471 RepID=A0A1J1H2Y6_PLARL|nr:conserved Plasmodium membrane protein, unknown function [Plasmodium relictum]CRG99078.1 conserved Plasmodium membrane protein, unknown function [Plasmodium relictum]
MIKALYKSIVNFLLSSFFENIEEKQLQTSLLRGKVHLQNVKIKKNFFDILYLPYTIKYGYIRSLDLHIPLFYLFQKATLKISDVVIVIKEKNFSEFNIEEEIYGIKEFKKNNLKIEDINNNFYDLNQKIHKGINYLLYEVYNNMSIDIENVEILLESSDKKKYILGLFIKNISSVKSNNDANKISKEFSFLDIIFYMNDDKAKYLINKVIKKEQKKIKNKRNINEEELYNKIRNICFNLHRKKNIISEIPIIVINTNIYLSNCTEYAYRNSKYIFKKNDYFDITCSHCDKYLFQCKEVKKDKNIFQKIFLKKENKQRENREFTYESYNKRNNSDKEKYLNTNNFMNNVNDSINGQLVSLNDKIKERKNVDNEKNVREFNENNVYFKVSSMNENFIEKFEILEENINFRENEYMNFEIKIDKLNFMLSFKQLNYIFDFLNFYFIYSYFINGLSVEEWLNIPEINDILIYKQELTKKKNKEKYDKDFIEKFEYLHSFQIISSLKRHVFENAEKKNKNDSKTSVCNDDISVNCSCTFMIKKMNLNIYNSQKMNKIIRVNLNYFEYILKSYINNDFAYNILLNDINVYFHHKNKRYPLLEFFHSNSSENHKNEEKKKENFKKNKRKGKNYIFNTYLSNSSSFKNNSSIKNKSNSIYMNDNLKLNEVKFKEKKQLNFALNERSFNWDFYSDNNLNNKQDDLLKDKALSVLVYKKFETSQSKIYIKSNQIIIITLGIKEIYSILNINYDYKTVDLEKKIKRFKNIYYYYLLGKKYCKELYIASEKNFIDINFDFIKNIYFNIVINKKYSILLCIKNLLLNSFFFTKTYLHTHLNNLFMLKNCYEAQRKYEKTDNHNNFIGKDFDDLNATSDNLILCLKNDIDENFNIDTLKNSDKNLYNDSIKGTYDTNALNTVLNNNTKKINKYNIYKDTICLHDESTKVYRKYQQEFLKVNNLKENKNIKNTCGCNQDNINRELYLNKENEDEFSNFYNATKFQETANDTYNIYNNENNIFNNEKNDCNGNLNKEECLNEEINIYKENLFMKKFNNEKDKDILTTVKQKRMNFEFSIFVLKNRKKKKIQNILFHKNKSSRYIIKPMKIYIDEITYNFKDSNDKKLTFIHSSSKNYLNFTINDKIIFKIIFFYYHYKHYIDKILEKFKKKENTDYLNLNTIDIRSYKTLQILLDNATINNKSEIKRKIEKNEVNENEKEEKKSKNCCENKEVNNFYDNSDFFNETKDNEFRINNKLNNKQNSCIFVNQLDNINSNKEINTQNVSGNENLKLNDTNNYYNKENKKKYKKKMNNNSTEEISIEGENIKKYKVHINEVNEEKKEKKKNSINVYSSDKYEELSLKKDINNMEYHNEDTQEIVFFLNKIKIHVNDYKQNNRMISVHLSDIFIYFFYETRIYNFLFNLKKINVLNCLSYNDNYNSFLPFIDKKNCINNLNKKNSKLNERRKNANVNSIYFYNSIFKLVKNGNFLLSFSSKNNSANNISTCAQNDQNIYKNSKEKNNFSNNNVEYQTSNEINYIKSDNYGNLYSLYSDKINCNNIKNNTNNNCDDNNNDNSSNNKCFNINSSDNQNNIAYNNEKLIRKNENEKEEYNLKKKRNLMKNKLHNKIFIKENEKLDKNDTVYYNMNKYECDGNLNNTKYFNTENKISLLNNKTYSEDNFNTHNHNATNNLSCLNNLIKSNSNFNTSCFLMNSLSSSIIQNNRGREEDANDDEEEGSEKEDEEDDEKENKEKNENTKSFEFHMINSQLIIDYLYFIHLFKWFNKLSRKFEKIKEISDFAYNNKTNEGFNLNNVKYNYNFFIQNNRIYTPIYDLSIAQYTYYDNLKNNSYISFLPVLEFHFSCSYKSLNSNDESVKSVQVRNLGSKLIMPCLNIHKHKKNKKFYICVLNFNGKNKSNETIINDLRFQINIKRKINYEVIENEENSSTYENLSVSNYDKKLSSLNTFFTAISKNSYYGENNFNLKNFIDTKEIISFYNDPIILNFSNEILKNAIICYNTFSYFLSCCNKMEDKNNDSNIIRDILYYLYNKTDFLLEYFLDDIRFNFYDGNSNRNMPLIVVSIFNLKLLLQKDRSIYNFLNFHLHIDIYDNYKILYDTLLEKMEIYLTFENNKKKINILNLKLETSYINILYTNKNKNILIGLINSFLDKNLYLFSPSYKKMNIINNRRKCNFKINSFIIKKKEKLSFSQITSKIYNYTGLSINVRLKQSLRNKIQKNSSNNKNKNKYIFYELQNNEHGGLLNDENGEVCEVVVIIKIFNYVFEIVDIEKNKNTCEIRFLPIVYELKKRNEKKRIMIKKYDFNFDMYNEYSLKNKTFKTFIKLYIQTNIDEKGIVSIYFSSNLFINNTTNSNFVLLFHPVLYYFQLFNKKCNHNSFKNIENIKNLDNNGITTIKPNEKYFLPLISFVPIIILFDYLNRKNNIEECNENKCNLKNNCNGKINYNNFNTVNNYTSTNYYINNNDISVFKKKKKKSESFSFDYTNRNTTVKEIQNFSKSKKYNYSFNEFKSISSNNLKLKHYELNFRNSQINLSNISNYKGENDLRYGQIMKSVNLNKINESDKIKKNKILKRLEKYISEKSNKNIKNINYIYIIKKEFYDFYISKYENKKSYFEIFNFLMKNGAKKLLNNSSLKEIIYRHSFDFLKYNIYAQTMKLKTLKIIFYDKHNRYMKEELEKKGEKNEDNFGNYNENESRNENEDEYKTNIGKEKEIEKKNYEVNNNNNLTVLNNYNYHGSMNKSIISYDKLCINEKYLNSIYHNKKSHTLTSLVKYDTSKSYSGKNMFSNESFYLYNSDEKRNAKVNYIKSDETRKKKKYIFTAKKQSNYSNTIICEQKNLEVNKIYSFGVYIDYIFEIHNFMYEEIKIGYCQNYYLNNLPKKIKRIKRETIMPKSIKYLDTIPSYINFFYVFNNKNYVFNFFSKKIQLHQFTNALDKSFRVKMHIGYINDNKNNIIYKKKKYKLNLLKKNSKYNNKKYIYLESKDYEQLCKEIPKFFFLNLTLRKKTDFLNTYKENNFKHVIDSNVLQLLIYSLFHFQNNLDKDLIVKSNGNSQKIKKKAGMFFGDIDNSKVVFEIFYNNQIFVSKKIKINEVCINKKIILTSKNKKENIFLSMNITLNGKIYNTKTITLNNRYTIINNTNRTLYVQEVSKEFKIIKKEKKNIDYNNSISLYNLYKKNFYSDKKMKKINIISDTDESNEKKNKSKEKVIKEKKIEVEKDEFLKKDEKNKFYKKKKEYSNLNHEIPKEPLNIISIKPYESFYYHPINTNKCFLKFSYADINECMNNVNFIDRKGCYEFTNNENDIMNLFNDYLKKKIIKSRSSLLNEENSNDYIKNNEDFFNLFYTSPVEIEKVGNFKIFHKTINKIEKKIKNNEKTEIFNNSESSAKISKVRKGDSYKIENNSFYESNVIDETYFNYGISVDKNSNEKSALNNERISINEINPNDKYILNNEKSLIGDMNFCTKDTIEKTNEKISENFIIDFNENEKVNISNLNDIKEKNDGNINNEKENSKLDELNSFIILMENEEGKRKKETNERKDYNKLFDIEKNIKDLMEYEEERKNEENKNDLVKEYQEYYYEYKEESVITEINIAMNRNTNIEINVSIENNPDTIIYNKTNYYLIFYQRKTKKKIVNLLKPFDKEIFGWSDVSKPKVIKCFLIFKKNEIYIFSCNLNIVKEHNNIILNNNKRINVLTKIENGKRVFCLEEMNKENEEKSIVPFLSAKDSNKFKTQKKLHKINFYNNNEFNELKQKKYIKLKKDNLNSKVLLLNKNRFNIIYFKKKKRKKKKKKSSYFRFRSFFILKNIDINNKEKESENLKKKKKKKGFTKNISHKEKKKSISFKDLEKDNKKIKLNKIFLKKEENKSAPKRSLSKSRKSYSKKYKNNFNDNNVTKEKNDSLLLNENNTVKGYDYLFNVKFKKKLNYDENINEGFLSVNKNSSDDNTSSNNESNACINENSKIYSKKYYKNSDENCSESYFFNRKKSKKKIKRKLSDYIFKKIKKNRKKLKDLTKIYPIFLKRSSRSDELNTLIRNYLSNKENSIYSQENIKNNEENNILHHYLDSEEVDPKIFKNYCDKKGSRKENMSIKFITNLQLLLCGIKINLFEHSSDYMISFELNDLLFKKEYIENIDYYNVDIKISNILCYTIYKYLSAYAILYTNDDINLKNNHLRMLINELQVKRNLFIDKKYDLKSVNSSVSSIASNTNNKPNESDVLENAEFLICNFQYIRKCETLFFKYFLLSIKPIVINADINSITILFYFYKTFYNKKKTEKENVENDSDSTKSESNKNRNKKSISDIKKNYYSSFDSFENIERKEEKEREEKEWEEMEEFIEEDLRKKENDEKQKVKENLEKNEVNKYVYLQYISIDNINILLNFQSEYKKELNNRVNDLFYKEYISAYNKLGDISNCNIFLKSLSNIHIFTNYHLLINFLQNFYYNQTIVNISNLLISFNIIGSPTSLIAHIKKAFNEFFYIINDNSTIKKDYNNQTKTNKNKIGHIQISKEYEKNDLINLLNESNESSFTEEKEDIINNRKYIMHILNDHNSYQNNFFNEECYFNNIKKSKSCNATKREEEGSFNNLSYFYKNNIKNRELENLVIDDNASINSLLFNNKKNLLLLNREVNNNKKNNDNINRVFSKKEITKTKKKCFPSAIQKCTSNIRYICIKGKRILIGLYVLFIQLILSLLFSITLILQSLINLIEKININNVDNVFLVFNKKYERKQIFVFNNIEEYNNFNITKLFYYYISIYINIVKFIWHNVLYKMKKNKKDLSGKNKIFIKKLKANLKKKRKFSFLFNFFLNILNIINIFLFGHIVFSLLFLLTMNNLFQNFLRCCIKLVYYQSNKNYLDFLNKNNINHMNIISYIKINQIINKYILLKEPFKYFLSYQDFMYACAPKKMHYFVYTKELFFYIQENKIVFLFRKCDLKSIDITIHTINHSFGLNSYYKRKGSKFVKKSRSKNTFSNYTINLDNLTYEENNSISTSIYNKSSLSNNLIENKNIIYFLNSELALTKRNEIININNRNSNYIISVKITIKNNMNIVESAYYNPKKFFQSFSKIQKSFNNIYLPLCKNINYEVKSNKEKKINSKKDTVKVNRSLRFHNILTDMFSFLKKFFKCFSVISLFRSGRLKNNVSNIKKKPKDKNRQENTQNKKIKNKDFKKMAPNNITFKLNFDDFHSSLNIFECLCRYSHDN